MCSLWGEGPIYLKDPWWIFCHFESSYPVEFGCLALCGVWTGKPFMQAHWLISDILFELESWKILLEDYGCYLKNVSRSLKCFWSKKAVNIKKQMFKIHQKHIAWSVRFWVLIFGKSGKKYRSSSSKGNVSNLSWWWRCGAKAWTPAWLLNSTV